MFSGFVKKIEKLDYSKLLLILFAAWLIDQVVLYNYCNGLRIVFDSHRYINGAQNPDLFYSYSYLLIPFIKTSYLEGVSVFQVVLNALAFYCYLNMIKDITQSKILYLIGGFFFLWPDLQIWNYYIHTESIFVSLSVFAIYFYIKQKFKISFFILVILCFVRPNGFIFPLGFCIAFLYQKLNVKYFTIVSIFIIKIMFAVSILYILPNSKIFISVKSLCSGIIIQGYDGWIINSSNFIISKLGNKLEQVVFMILNNPIFYLKFFGTRCLALFSQVRPYYTLLHNLLIFITFLFVYIGFFFSIFKAKFKEISYLLLPVIFQTIIVMVSGVDWDNRFIAIVLVNIFLISIVGYDRFLKTKYLSSIFN